MDWQDSMLTREAFRSEGSWAGVQLKSLALKRTSLSSAT
jgi:hypothetical protein